ncbi:MAG: type IV pilin N-terminal domain-containing protein [Methanospirillum sp.]|nr:type IV pilin N-terminal domain-containing protein [Methanospirillum sp.]
MRAVNDHAVSPVVGVMLMLVVTILIAAVVSAFAGGMGSANEKSPQATIRGTYSITDGITIEHIGGDPIAIKDVRLTIRGSSNIGTYWTTEVVNRSTITNAAGTAWMKTTGSAGVSAFVAGDIAYIKPPYHTGPFLQPDVSYTSSYWNQSSNIGKTLIVEMTDQQGKRTFAKTEIPIVN